MIGRMRHRVQVQAETVARSSYGEPTATWTTLATVPAAVEPAGGTEVLRAGKTETERVYVVTMRAYSGLTSKHRLVWGSITLEIDAVTDVSGRGVWVQVLCRAQG